MQQGRVQLDADWNEQLDIQAHLDHTTALDVIGPCGVPETGGGFQVGLTPGGNDLSLTAGRIYVDGILCENLADWVSVLAITGTELTIANLLLDGAPLKAGQWLEISGQGAAPTPPMAQVDSIDNAGKITFATAGNYGTLTGAKVRRAATYLTQPDLPSPAHAKAGPPACIDLTTGDYLAYLDVWQRGLTAHEDTSILEKALGGPDTAFRSMAVWQLQITEIKNPQGPLGCGVQFSDWNDLVDRPLGGMAAQGKVPDQQSGDPLCLLPPGSNYNGLENQLYRIEIHAGGALGTATFKWSRENGSVEARWLGISGQELKVDSTGRDSVLGFTGAGSIELVDDSVDLLAAPKAIGLIKGYTVADDTTIVLPQAVNLMNKMPDATLNPRIRRWENEQEIKTSGNWIPLERGVEVQFADGGAVYAPGDYWLVSARTASGTEIGDIEWPVDSLGGHLFKAPDGVRHHFCRLAIFHTAANVITLGDDCRAEFPSLTAIDAEDVAYTGSCAGAGPTVETALDFLCANTQIPDHNLHLHGTGIVCGLQVHCGPDSDSVKILDGYAIAHDGTVVDFEDTTFNVIKGASTWDQNHPNDKIVTDQPNQGDGEAALYLALDEKNAWMPIVEPYDPSKDTPQSRLDGTLLMDIYNDCIKKLRDWLQRELDDPSNTSPASKADQLRSALINLSYQIVNPQSGQNIFLSPREDKLLSDFYQGLKAQLQSDTFCAMFANARPYPVYANFKSLQNLGMDTIFGKGTHTRLRLRPGANEAYTVGPGVNPVAPQTTLNRYDLAKGVLVSVVDPLAGVDLSKGPTSSGVDSARDIAFVGNRIWVIIPTRDGQNTILRSGVFAGSNINWDNTATLCGVKLVTLATTAADQNNLYGIGQGSGLYKIDLSNLANVTATRVGSQFAAVGHLRITDDGRAFATAGNASTGIYTKVVAINVKTGADLAPVNLTADGRDDIAIDPSSSQLYVVQGGHKTVAKFVAAYSMNTGSAIGGPVAVHGGGIQLEDFVPTGQILMAMRGDYSVRLFDVKTNTVAAQYLLPMQVDPIAIATDSKNVYVLNYVSNTITTITKAGHLLTPTYDYVSLLNDLSAYRKAALEAFADLAGGFAEYLKDCICDHLLVNCPDPEVDSKLYLAAVRIRGGKVDKICNLSKRHYVKTFPTVGYWLSLFPVIPLVKWAIAQFCCITIPDATSKFQANQGGSNILPGQPGSNPIELLQELLMRSQGANLSAVLGTAFSGSGTIGRLLADAFIPRQGAAPAVDVAVASAQPQLGVVRGGQAIAGQPTVNAVGNLKAAGVNVEVLPYQPSPGLVTKSIGAFFTDPTPGSTVTLYDQGGSVQAYTVMPQGPTAELQAHVNSLTQSVQAKDAQITQLQGQLAQVQVQHAELLAVQRQHAEAVSSLRAMVEARAAASMPTDAIVTPTPAAAAPDASGAATETIGQPGSPPAPDQPKESTPPPTTPPT